MAAPGQAPRQTANKVLNAVIGEGLLLSETLPAAVGRLAPEDRARVGRLTTQCLRWMYNADRVLGRHLRKLPPLSVMNVLRLGVVEICVEGAAAHGVVNSAVDIVRADPKTKMMAGLVNAVLRKVAKDGPKIWEKLPAPQLPKWLRKPLIADFGKPTVREMEKAHAAGAALDLTVKSNPEKWAATLGGTVLPNGSVRIVSSVQVSALDGFDAGDWWVQDCVATLPAQILAATADETVLDMCAAPGGKTLQLATTGAKVTAIDVSEKRMKRVAENLERTKLIAELVVADALEFQDRSFDAILLDAPCSATGTIRRHPDLPYAKDGSNFPKLFQLQERMIDHALTLLKPNGRLVYCTCSLLFDEGEEQIKDAMVRHSGLQIDHDALKIPFVDAAWINDFGLRTRPDFWAEEGGMDGFFMTVLRKPA